MMIYRSLIQALLVLVLILSPTLRHPSQAAEYPDEHTPGLRHTGRTEAHPALAPLFAPAVVLNPPTDLTASVTSRSTIALIWVDQSENETGFRIERSLDGLQNWRYVGWVISNTTTFVDSHLTCNTPYFYRVRAIDGTGVSPPSASASATILDCHLDAPIDLSARPTVRSSIQLTWSYTGDNATGFTIERSPDGATGWSVIGQVSAYRYSFLDGPLECSPPLFYRVRATNPGAVSEWSTSASMQICPPADPTALSAAVLSRMNIALAWVDTSDNETGFAIQRSLDGVTNWRVIDQVPTGATAYTSRGLSCATTYFYRVRAFHPSAGSGFTQVVSATTAACLPQIIYVQQQAAGVNTGASWDAAYADLQDALTAAIPGDQIWVAAGSYRPNSRFVDRGSLLSAFQIPDRVAMYGGFQGGETSVAQRDWQQHPTVLFGNGAYHVITTAAVSAATVLDGFTITGGSASGDIGPLTVGAGWQNDHGSPTIRNCIFENNYATGSGAGLNNTQGSPLLSHVVFRKNTAEASGGGMTNYGGTPILQDVVFQQNQVSNGIVGRGGGFANLGGGSATLVDVTFEGNTSASIGGGIANDAATLTISVATFQGNRGEVGGAIGHIGNGTLVISDATFLGNVAQMGGGVANLASKLSIHHATFQRNSASYAGGGVFVQYATDLNELHTLVFSGNYAHEGAGIAFEGSAGSVGNATFVGNRSWYGPALFGSYSALLVQNSIVWENEPLEGGQVNGVNIRYSLVQGGATGPGNTSADPRFVNGAGNDHRFGSDDDDLRLRAGSPAIDAGDASVLPATVTTDHAGAPRFVDDPTAPDIGLGSGPAIDMGAYEYQNVLPLPMPTELSVAPIRRAQITLHWQDNSADEQVFLIERSTAETIGWAIIAQVGADTTSFTDRLLPCNTTFYYRVRASNAVGNSGFATTLAVTTRACEPTTIYVDQRARAGGQHGENWADAYLDLQEALKIAIPGDQIWVARGTYLPGAQRTDSFVLRPEVDLYGGFVGSETALAQRDWQANATVLSGDIGIPGTANDNVFHVLTAHALTRPLTIDGFTITSGTAEQLEDQGGGLLAQNAQLTLRNLHFRDNLAKLGGAIVSDASSLTIEHVMFSANTAALGGGMFIYNASVVTITQALFAQNHAIVGGNAYPDGIGGGGLMAMESDLRLAHVTFRGNETSNEGGNGFAAGGGMSVQRGHVTLRAVDFSDNRSEIGGGMFNSADDARLAQITFTGNHASWWGGGLQQAGQRLQLQHATFEQNTASGGGGLFLSGSGSMLVNTVFRYNTAYVGGAVMLYGGDPIIANALIAQNRVSAHGGGMYNTSTAFPTLVGVTISGNIADARGGAIYNEINSYSSVRNSILWGNAAAEGAEIYALDMERSSINYSVIAGGQQGIGNLDADPRFVRSPSAGSDGQWGTADDAPGDLHLRADSPAIDAGNNDAIPHDTLDLDADGDLDEPLPRSLDDTSRRIDDPDQPDRGHGLAPIVDLGAYEFAPAPPHSELQVELSSDRTLVRPGDVLTFAILVRNAGPDPARGITVTISLPAGLELSATHIVAAPDWSCTDRKAEQQLRCTHEQLAVGITTTITVSGRLSTTSDHMVIAARVESRTGAAQPAQAAIQLIAAAGPRRLWFPWIRR